MKRKLLLLSVLAICVATLAAGTLAYFSADGTARNVITTGNAAAVKPVQLPVTAALVWPGLRRGHGRRCSRW